jgi:putative ABC transport system permease protein
MRRAIRSLGKAPGFSAAVVLTLAIGLGANAALFAVVNRILLRPLPYPDPARLVAVGETRDGLGGRPGPASAPVFLAWQRASRTLERLAAYRAWGFVLTGSGEPERLAGARVSAGLFPLLGVTPLLGRTFTPDEDRFGAPRVALVSEALWERRLGSDRDVTRRSIVLNGVAHAVIGVVPRGFHLPDADVFVPLALEPFTLAQPGNRALTVVGRLRPGQTPVQASAEMDAIARRLATGEGGLAHRSLGEGGASAVALTDYLVRPSRPTVLIAWGAVALVLLIACANTASLMLARAASRRQEIAVCRALGASRSRLAARVLSESLVLALAGGILGLPLALALLRAVVTLAPPDLPRLDGIGLDVPLLLFTAGLSAATAILFGFLPAVRSSRADLSADLRAGGRGAVGGTAHATLRHLAVSCQVGLTMIVLVGAGLLVRSFARVAAVDPGFTVDEVLTMTVSLPDQKYGDPQRRTEFFREVLQRTRALPGVQSVGFVSHTPLAGAPLVADVSVEGAPAAPAGEMLFANCSVVGGDWFTAMRIPLLRGRAFTDRDVPGVPLRVIINARLAARLWPNADPIGRRLVVGGTLGADRAPREVVGIVGDVRASLEAAPPDQVYVPHAQNPWPTMTMMARTAGDPSRWGNPLRSAVSAIDPDQAVYNLRPFDDIIARALAVRRFQVFVLSLFAAVALVLAATGVYSVVSYGVRLRRQEVGVRFALGARKADVLRLAVGDSLRWSAAGLAGGTLVAFFAARTLAGVLYEVPATDFGTFAGAIAAAMVVVLFGSSIAARAAFHVDPVIALKGESQT